MLRNVYPSFVDEMLKISAARGRTGFRRILPAITLGGAVTGAGLGLVRSHRMPSARRLKYIANATTLGTGIGWLPDVASSGIRAIRGK